MTSAANVVVACCPGVEPETVEMRDGAGVLTWYRCPACGAASAPSHETTRARTYWNIAARQRIRFTRPTP